MSFIRKLARITPNICHGKDFVKKCTTSAFYASMIKDGRSVSKGIENGVSEDAHGFAKYCPGNSRSGRTDKEESFGRDVDFALVTFAAAVGKWKCFDYRGTFCGANVCERIMKLEKNRVAANLLGRGNGDFSEHVQA